MTYNANMSSNLGKSGKAVLKRMATQTHWFSEKNRPPMLPVNFLNNIKCSENMFDNSKIFLHHNVVAKKLWLANSLSPFSQTVFF